MLNKQYKLKHLKDLLLTKPEFTQVIDYINYIYNWMFKLSLVNGESNDIDLENKLKQIIKVYSASEGSQIQSTTVCSGCKNTYEITVDLKNIEFNNDSIKYMKNIELIRYLASLLPEYIPSYYYRIYEERIQTYLRSIGIEQSSTCQHCTKNNKTNWNIWRIINEMYSININSVYKKEVEIHQLGFSLIEIHNMYPFELDIYYALGIKVLNESQITEGET